ncbi:MAG: hypothetical protein E7616_02895 [Ruminococcaceae bacterium]|nr:hypothetical protein [Oscillospiraceae bacterium]
MEENKRPTPPPKRQTASGMNANQQRPAARVPQGRQAPPSPAKKKAPGQMGVGMSKEKNATPPSRIPPKAPSSQNVSKTNPPNKAPMAKGAPRIPDNTPAKRASKGIAKAAGKPPVKEGETTVNKQNTAVRYAAPKKKFSIKEMWPFGWISRRKKAILESERDIDAMPDNVVRVRGGIDRPMLVLILILLCYGSVMVFSASYAYALSDMGDSYYYIRRQIAFVVLGLIAMVGVAHLDYKFIQKMTPLVFVGCLGMMVMVLINGISEGDAQRWLYIGPISIQASEPMKLGLVLMLSWYYHKTYRFVKTKLFWRSSAVGTFVPLLIVALVCMLILLENHFSGTIIMFAIGMMVIFAAGGKWIWFGLGTLGFGAGVGYLIFATDYASKRIDIWLHPENYSTQGEVWQTLQGLSAIGSGGLLGVGLGNSTQKHLFVSEPQNDFIYSIICEELGLIGAILVIGLFLAFVWRGIKIAQNTPDVFSRLAVIGIVSQVGIQAFLNIAVVTGTIPNTGITLPFFSYGGSSLTILLVEMGVILSISRYSYQQK